jgi:hypothetical protein
LPCPVCSVRPVAGRNRRVACSTHSNFGIQFEDGDRGDACPTPRTAGKQFHAAFIRTVLDRTTLCRFRSWCGVESARRLASWNKIPKPERVEAAVYSTGLAHLQDAYAPFNPASASGPHSRRNDPMAASVNIGTV